MKRYLTEALGTFFLTLIVALTGNPLAIGLLLMAIVYIGAHISGAHYNGALSVSAWLAGKLDTQTTLGYYISQVVGTLLAIFFFGWMTGLSFLPAPAVGIDLMKAGIFEFLGVFLFAFVFLTLNSNVSKLRDNDIYGLAIGFALTALIMFAGPISGGVLNPSIALGAGLLELYRNGSSFLSTMLMYVGGGLLGATGAAYAHHFLNE